MNEFMQSIAPDKLTPCAGHPFQLREDAAMDELVDEGRIAFSPAVELSYLTKEQQAYLLDSIEQEDATPSLSQAIRTKKLSQQGKLTSGVSTPF